MRTDFLASLAGILGRLEPEQREVLKQCVEWDIAALEEARRSVAEGEKNIWIHLRSLAMVRQDFEPMDARDVSERALLQLVLEIIDDGIGRILVDSPSGLLLAVTSPYGMVP
ncbi:MAG: hypothetical protein GY906_36585, partial [bacterium]|nr:hypothetical protein [bacterium]